MNLRYYHTERLIITILILTFFITPISGFIENYISKIDQLNTPYGYVGIFSTVSILVLILTLINTVLWKFKIFRWLVNIPNLNGRYEGELISSFIDPVTNLPTKKKCVIEISQNASECKINSYYGDWNTQMQTSDATSVLEEIVKKSNGVFEVFYVFSNTANALQNHLHNHIGTCSLKYFKDIKTLDGEYYNQRGFKGTIKVTFTQKELLGRLI